MKKLLTLSLSILLAISTFAQEQENWLWLIAGTEAGDGIIYKPQQYIDDELVFSQLFITAPEGSFVFAPADGVIERIGINEYLSLSSSRSTSRDGESIDERLSSVLEKHSDDFKYHDYLSGALEIKLANGDAFHISGLRGDIPFKTGMKIHRGDTLGTVWKCYYKIKKPHIRISVSRKGAGIDPMSPFGLESTFIPAKEVKIPTSLTAEQAREDLEILFEAYEECYPSKYDILTPQEDTLFRRQAFEKVADGVDYTTFKRIVHSTTEAEYCHDSHLTVLTQTPASSNLLLPQLMISALHDSLIVFNSAKGLEHYIGRRVISIDGKPAEYYVENAYSKSYMFDADNKSYRDVQNMNNFIRIYGDGYHSMEEATVMFEDSSIYIDKWIPFRKYQMTTFVANDIAYQRNAYGKQIDGKDYRFERLNDSTGMFTLRTFDLSTVQLEEIVDSIKALSPLPNMIVDVRNNPGGSPEVLCRLLAHFITERPVPLHQYHKVNSNTAYASFRHSQNYSPDIMLYGDYESRKGKSGYFKTDSSYARILPDTSVNYRGKLYILTGENTMSAASLFASFLVRNHRAVTVGRETGSGYHWMTAINHVDIFLPNSKIQVRIPLIKIVFDDTVTERTPLGRGLIPDFEVPLTFYEYQNAPNDIILEKALSLIADGQYLGENPFAGIDAPEKKTFPLRIVISCALIVLLAVLMIVRKRSK